MVAILEVGAFCRSSKKKCLCSLFSCRGTDRRYHRTKTDHLVWGLDFCRRRNFSNFCMEYGGHDYRTHHLWSRRGSTLVIPLLSKSNLSTIVPVYQSEISPPHNRGKLACIEFTGNIVGYASSVWVDYFCSFLQSHWSWRAPLFMQCIMGSLLALGALIISETPR